VLTNKFLVLVVLSTEANILHRDISPHNILFVRDEDGKANALLIDFDYAVMEMLREGQKEGLRVSHGFRTVCTLFLLPYSGS
jgi:serine/threonine protein kinase